MPVRVCIGQSVVIRQGTHAVAFLPRTGRTRYRCNMDSWAVANWLSRFRRPRFPLLGFRYRNRFKPPAPPKKNPSARVEPARIRLIPGEYV